LRFNEKHATAKNNLTRLRKFNPQNFFLSVLELAAATNFEGFDFALRKTWENLNLPLTETPLKSSLSDVRKKVSYEFFKEIFEDHLKALEKRRKLYRGFHVYAVDGDQLELPASKDVLEHGYQGYPSSKNRETHFPKMYTTQVLDVINGSIRNFSFSTHQDEVHLAREFVDGFEKNSIAIYDRLHCGYDTFLAHQVAGNYFIVRARVGQSCSTSGRGVHLEIQEFCRSNSRSKEVLWKPVPGKIKKNPQVFVRFAWLLGSTHNCRSLSTAMGY
jgi:hypothetical protein